MQETVFILKTDKELYEEAKIKALEIAPLIPDYLEKVADYGGMPTFEHYKRKGISKFLFWLKNRKWIAHGIDESMMDYRIKYESILKERNKYYEKMVSIIFDALKRDKDYYLNCNLPSIKLEESNLYKFFKEKGDSHP